MRRITSHIWSIITDMNASPPDDLDHTPLLQLWVLRALQPDRTRKGFVQKQGFRDDDVARFLELHDWVDCDQEKFDRKQIFREMDQALARLEADPPPIPRACQRNCNMLGRKVGLSRRELSLLYLLTLFSGTGIFRDLMIVADVKTQREIITLFARMLGMTAKQIQHSTSHDSPLLSSALAKWSRDHRSRPRFGLIDESLGEKLIESECSIKALLGSFVHPAPSPTLSFRDYPHITETVADMRQHIRCALRSKKAGVNIFIHGRPGTGKSELSRVIARDMRAELYEIAFEDEEGDPVTGLKRLEHLRAAQSLLKNQRSLLVYDEAEDVFSGEGFLEKSLASKRKAWMNRFFESNAIPTFWISNSNRLDPAFLRRFDFILELKVPPRRQRMRTLRKICSPAISQHLVEKLAHFNSLSPGIVAKAHEVASGIYGEAPNQDYERALVRQIKQTLEAQDIDTQQIEREIAKVPGLYDLQYLSCDLPLDTLPRNILNHRACRICLYGPPGTGKTTLGYWLARETGQEIVTKKASDLIGPYLGMTERNIAEAFEQAAEDNSILMIDEVDSFLQDRNAAQRSFEVQHVNELLTQMEHFEGTFIASTNLMDGIDQAALRRFDLKLRFGYLNGEQLQGLLLSSCRELNLTAPLKADHAAIRQLANATPGDFANCRRQARFRSFRSASEFVDAIAQECRIKADRGNRKLGFSN